MCRSLNPLACFIFGSGQVTNLSINAKANKDCLRIWSWEKLQPQFVWRILVCPRRSRRPSSRPSQSFSSTPKTLGQRRDIQLGLSPGFHDCLPQLVHGGGKAELGFTEFAGHRSTFVLVFSKVMFSPSNPSCNIALAHNLFSCIPVLSFKGQKVCWEGLLQV